MSSSADALVSPWAYGQGLQVITANKNQTGQGSLSNLSDCEKGWIREWNKGEITDTNC